tara:strand:- start:1419 stop:1613 length:195 start_codon:yes stop_codon:yes gene_type:complete
MKLLKYTLLVIGILGVIACVYNTFYTGAILDQMNGFMSSSLLLIASFNLDKLIDATKNFKFPGA